MKKLIKIFDILLYMIVALSLIAAITSAIWKKPFLLSSVRSNSMYPLFERSDMLLIKNVSKHDPITIGDIIVFEDKEGSLSSKGWIVHRIIGGDEISGYITKGDANNYTDQSSGASLIKKEWIAGKVFTIEGRPLKIPLIGYLPLWMENFQKNTYTMPIIAVILAFIIGLSELTTNKKSKKSKKKKNNNMELQLVYFFGGITISIVIGATMLISSEHIVVPYTISNNSTGVIIGSSIGTIMLGDEITKPISELKNDSFLPVVSVITTNDKQITFNYPIVLLKQGNNINAEMTLSAHTVGSYNSTIHVGIFYPFLPSKLIYSLASQSYWLALIIVSLIPGLPLILYPIIDGRLRRKTIKEIRRKFRRIRNYIPIFN